MFLYQSFWHVKENLARCTALNRTSKLFPIHWFCLITLILLVLDSCTKWKHFIFGFSCNHSYKLKFIKFLLFLGSTAESFWWDSEENKSCLWETRWVWTSGNLWLACSIHQCPKPHMFPRRLGDFLISHFRLYNYPRFLLLTLKYHIEITWICLMTGIIIHNIIIKKYLLQ